MEIEEIKDLVQFFDKSESTSIEVQQGEFRIKIEKNAKNTPVVIDAKATLPADSKPALEVDKTGESDKKAKENEVDGQVIKAPLVGIFYAAPSPEAEAYVQVGTQVKEGQVLCLIEAMKMMSEITAPKDGTIKKIYVKNQDVVGFEDPLFVIGD